MLLYPFKITLARHLVLTDFTNQLFHLVPWTVQWLIDSPSFVVIGASSCARESVDRSSLDALSESIPVVVSVSSCSWFNCLDSSAALCFSSWTLFIACSISPHSCVKGSMFWKKKCGVAPFWIVNRFPRLTTRVCPVTPQIQSLSLVISAMPASPIASNYLLNEWRAPLEVHGTRAPLQRKLRGQHKQIVTAHRLESEHSKMPHGACAALAWAAKDDCLESSASNTNFCYQRLSLATVVMLRTYNFKRPWSRWPPAAYIRKSSAREGFWTWISQQPLTFSHRCWSYFEQTVTTPHQLYPAKHRIYRRLGRCSGSVILFFSHSVHRAVGEFAAIASYVCERLSIYRYWPPSWIRPLLSKLTTLFPSKGWQVSAQSGSVYFHHPLVEQ